MILNILVFLIILTTIVSVHEFGHFITARFFGVYCGAFSIGMGPLLYRKKGKETDFEIRAIPIGGYVTMAGETDQEDNEEFKDVPLERTLKGIAHWKRVIVFLAGIFNNFVLALVIMFGVAMAAGEAAVDSATIGSIQANSAAATAGLQAGDTITNIKDADSGVSYAVSSFQDIDMTRETLQVDTDTTVVQITFTRDGEEMTKDLTVSYDEDNARYTLGISVETRRMTVSEAITYTFETFGAMCLAMVTVLRKLVTNFAGTVSQVSGPVGIYTITAQVTESGDIVNIFYLMALLSANIGVFNLLPIPGLDGFHALFAVIEGVIGREVPEKIKLALQVAGLALILLLMVVITFKDITQLIQ